MITGEAGVDDSAHHSRPDYLLVFSELMAPGDTTCMVMMTARSIDQLLKFSNITRPGIADQRLHGLRRDRVPHTLIPAAEFLYEVANEQRNDGALVKSNCIEGCLFRRPVLDTTAELFPVVNKNHEHEGRNDDLHEAPIQPNAEDVAISAFDVDE